MRGIWLALLASLLSAPTAGAGETEDFFHEIEQRILRLDGEIQRLTSQVGPYRQADTARLWRLANKLRLRSRLLNVMAQERDDTLTFFYPDDVQRDMRASLDACSALLDLDPEPELGARALLFMATLNRELGQFTEMSLDLARVFEQYPYSPQAAHALLLLGDHFFDHSNNGRAAAYYQRLIDRPDRECEAMARYKLGWILANDKRWAEAMAQFEIIASDPEPAPCIDEVSLAPAPLELPTEALLGLAVCYAHVHPADQVLVYFGRFPMPRWRAVTVYENLADELTSLGELPAARQVYRYLFTLSNDPDDVADWVERLEEIEDRVSVR